MWWKKGSLQYGHWCKWHRYNIHMTIPWQHVNHCNWCTILFGDHMFNSCTKNLALLNLWPISFCAIKLCILKCTLSTRLTFILIGIPYHGLDKSEVENYLSTFPYILLQGLISEFGFQIVWKWRNPRLCSHHVTAIKLSTYGFYLSMILL